MKFLPIWIGLFMFCASPIHAQELNPNVFALLNLDAPGLEQVKESHRAGKDREAAENLLEYYRNRTHVHFPDISDLTQVTISSKEQQWADDALEHTFFSHEGYQPSFNYGKDIDWRYWPVRDNELRWQLHRHKWFGAMGQAYCVSGDEKYAKEWVFQYMDWIKKNPLVKIDPEKYELTDDMKIKDDAENSRFAWRPLETSHRLQDQIRQFLYFVHSPHFTPEFLTEFLVNYHKHAEHILHNYSKQGNHLLFEAQRMFFAGTFFPEFKEAADWRKSGIDILNREIDIQVYPDGGQFELDPHYHLASIEIFCKALEMADANGLRNEFPQHYTDMIEKMIMFYINICFPDYTNPCFSDAKITGKNGIIRNLRKWSAIFPDNQYIKYFATDGKKGKLPEYLSQAFKESGFFVFRNAWQDPATVMIVKAGPEGEWHCQPDNGTFELWINGKNFFPDSGSYIYGGDDEVMAWRNWFRQTRVHNTLTLGNENITTTDSKTLLWEGTGDLQKLVTENQSYENLKHRRSVFFIENKFFVIVDEAIGNALGDVNLHFELCEGPVKIDSVRHTLTTENDGNTQIFMQCFGSHPLHLRQEEGWYSTAYRKKEERPAVAFDIEKTNAAPVRYITVIYPVQENSTPKISCKFNSAAFSDQGMDVDIKIDKKRYRLRYELH